MFLTYQAMLYHNKSGITVLPRSLYGKWTHSPIAFFDHYHASMWHSADAAVFRYFWSLRWYVALPAAIFGAIYVRHRYTSKVESYELEKVL